MSFPETTNMPDITAQISAELAIHPQQVSKTIALLDAGSTVPFIARYRKEVTGGLDDTQLRRLTERLDYLRELDERRHSILQSIDEQGKLDSRLKAAILGAPTKTELEDLYLPYKKKRRTKAQIAREAGLEPLAMRLLQHPDTDPEREAGRYIDTTKKLDSREAVLDGARQILMEHFAEQADLLKQLREYLWQHALLVSTLVKDKEQEGSKFRDYFDYREAIRKIPSHRALALFRGRNAGILRLSLKLDGEQALAVHPCQQMLMNHFQLHDGGRAADAWLVETARWAWKVKISTTLETELKTRLREDAEAQAIDVFAANLKDLLLAAPAGARTTLGLDPGLRTGVKLAVVDHTGKLLDTATLYPHAPKKRWDESIQALAALCARHKVELISIGNGTASRETDRLVAALIKQHPELGLTKVMVSEAGASVYSASELAAQEFPELDVSLRGAVSIARRLQDPLAELVKIEPKAIGVGQYQHDVSQAKLTRRLGAVVEDCVNSVGVDVNTASAPLLAQVAGLNTMLAKHIVDYRNQHGAFTNRRQLLEVPRLGPKAFEQAAGFLRIVNGDNPLDNSGVHPESYAIVETLLARQQCTLAQVIGNRRLLRAIEPETLVTDQVGLPTVTDILAELEKPGRDPRPEFKTASFQEHIETIADLKPDMILEGVISNVTNFGAFVDIGVHQDGLVHISMLADKFVQDPRTVVKAGDLVKVKVMAVELERRRIALSMRLNDNSRDYENGTRQRSTPAPAQRRPARRPNTGKKSTVTPRNNSMAEALSKALRKP